MAKPKLAGQVTTRKKSVSKASAAKGSEDSRAARVKQQEDARTRDAKGTPDKMADIYRERLHDVDKERKVHRGGKGKKIS